MSVLKAGDGVFQMLVKMPRVRVVADIFRDKVGNPFVDQVRFGLITSGRICGTWIISQIGISVAFSVVTLLLLKI
jgi:hypothetical protein